MGLLGGTVGKLLAVAVVVVLVAVAYGFFFFATDQPVDATVTDKDCRALGATVTVKTKMFGLDRSVSLDDSECAIINVGNFVKYHIRSGHTIVYEAEGGRCVYDTVKGPGCGKTALFG